MNRHFVLHKPYGYLSQFITNDKGKQPLLGALGEFPEGIMPIGRLDAKSEGLLLLTTDGMMSERVRSKKVEKEYYVLVDGDITEEAIERLKNGVEINVEGRLYTTLPCKAFKFDNTPKVPVQKQRIRDDRHGPSKWISITLKEGKFRQIRKMTAMVGFPTLRLIRMRVGHICLNELPAGEFYEVNDLLPTAFHE